jgi:predicted ATPase/DNA-binding SARP family transcriptional activator/Tfp pilus assembly protein PilF
VLRIRLLGGFAVEIDGHEVPGHAWRLRRAKTLVKLLALAPERRLHREQVVELLWPSGGGTPAGLHQVLYTARRALGGEPLTLHEDVVALSGEPVWLDVDAFERATASARDARDPAAYREALDLYTGELLPEDRYEDWAEARRESVRELHLALLVELATLQDDGAAIETLQRAVVEDPLHEVAHRALMRRFAAAGRRQQALAQYQQLRRALHTELAADPDPESRRLYREILAAEPEPATPAPDSGLPYELTSFVGRERELGELGDALEHTRLLTLTGPGGAGKTRLALELAARRADGFADGVRLVELAPVSDPAFVVAEVASALGVQQRSARDPIELLAERLGDARVLLVLDNCEHLIGACATLAERLLRACPNLRILATSRERLRIGGEVSWRVPPLALPPGSEAVELFCRRAADADPAFAMDESNAAAIADICRRLDGMPLALELAAARVAVLSPAQIAQRLTDALDLLGGGSRTGLTRQQTLRATLAWSHDLLDDAERELYRRLGIFAGGFRVDAVEDICVCEDALGVLARLVDKSLVQVEPGPDGNRYRLLETVRQDARERLAAAGEVAGLEADHRAWFLALAQAADRDSDPDVAGEWPVERLEASYDDLRAALASAVLRDPPAALRLACALFWFWMARGDFVEGRRWIEEALVAAPEPTYERARVLVCAGAMDLRTRGVPGMVALGEQALEILRGLGNRRGIARGYEWLGVMAMGRMDFPRAEEALGEGLELATALGDDEVSVAIRHAQGVLAGCRGENALARDLLGDTLERLEDIGDDAGPLFWAMQISPVVVPHGRGGRLRCYFEDTYCLFRAVRSRAATGYALCNIAAAWRSDGDFAAAQTALEQALSLFRELEDDLGAGVALNALGNLARSTGELEAGGRWLEEALALRRAARDARETATTLTSLGMLALSAGDEVEGERLMAEALAIYVRNDDGPGRLGLLLNTGDFALDAGDYERACAAFDECARGSRRQAQERSIAWSLAELAEAAVGAGQHERARAALAEALPLFERFPERRGVDVVRALQAQIGALAAG